QAQWGSLINRPAGLLLDPRLREGFARLAPLGLSFDAWVYHTQLNELTDLARAFPGTPIVLDHVGGPIGLGRYTGRRDEVFTEWQARIRELATCSNVHIKLGGLSMRMFGFDVHTRDLPPSSEDLAAAWRPYIEACIAACARCSKATSRSTRAAAAITCCGTPSSALPRVAPPPKRPRSFPPPPPNSTAWAERRSSQRRIRANGSGRPSADTQPSR
ncbi:MAG: amidohydrolase family protein, partial [Stellaceae bacterium]